MTDNFIIIRVRQGTKGGKLIAKGLSEEEASFQAARLMKEASVKRTGWRYLARFDTPFYKAVTSPIADN